MRKIICSLSPFPLHAFPCVAASSPVQNCTLLRRKSPSQIGLLFDWRSRTVFPLYILDCTILSTGLLCLSLVGSSLIAIFIFVLSIDD